MNSFGAIAVVLYIFGSSLEDLVEHLVSGYNLNSDLPENQLVYDSYFIHYIRLFILWSVFLMIVILVISFFCICTLLNNFPNFFRSGA